MNHPLLFPVSTPPTQDQFNFNNCFIFFVIYDTNYLKNNSTEKTPIKLNKPIDICK